MLLALLSTLGCYKIDYVTNTPVSGSIESADEDYWNHRVLWGIIEIEGPLELEEICAGGTFSKVHTEMDIITGLVNVLAASVVGGLYSGNMIYVWCENGTAYSGPLNGQGQVVELYAPVGQDVPPELGVATGTCLDVPMPAMETAQ
ncbi:MAG: hypothetical protein ACI9VR_002140 [Cognaticolwellia sp.]|jgi:hypothetical protein